MITHDAREPIELSEKTTTAWYSGNSIEDITAIVDKYRDDQAFWLPALLPDPFFIHDQDGEPLFFDSSNFPENFVANLLPSVWRGVLVYPIQVYEDPETRAVSIVNDNGDLLALAPAGEGYDPGRYAADLYAEHVDTGIAADLPELQAIYDPSRLVMRYRLMTGQSAATYLKIQSELAAAALAGDEPFGGDGEGMLLMGGVSDVFAVTAIEPHDSGTGRVVTVVFPEAVSLLDIFSSEGKGDYEYWEWALRVTTNVSGGSAQWHDSTAGSTTVRFYTAANAEVNALTDPDGDGLTWGREVYLYRTDPESWDTDGDGISDWDEIMVYGTDPNNPDTTPPEVSILHPASGSSYIWMP